MGSHNKVNLLVLIDEWLIRKVFRIDRYISYKNCFFILVTDEESFELLRLECSQESNELVSLSAEEAEEITSLIGIEQDINHTQSRYKTVGLLYSQEVSQDGSKSYHFKTSQQEENIDLTSFLHYFDDFNS
ncbi:hypothetical protein HNR77_004693 [Paenibacillus sp. JGP012]|uniref:hypothetical protein n=1 Tax=Paenibacillus sp. JGP012 TaxID=2735914 RepID=UPI0016097940|nr:hypothetical protein [Paenibacillus sp. JGP012]MBB6023592.1 hypothetical protein [Paenibacillus sp. JGP012]